MNSEMDNVHLLNDGDYMIIKVIFSVILSLISIEDHSTGSLPSVTLTY